MRPEIEQFKKFLGRWELIGDYVHHAREQIAQDESELIPNIIGFSYRGAGFWATITTNIRLEMNDPSGSGMIQVGCVNLLSDDAQMHSVLSAMFDPHVCTPIRLNEHGDTIYFKGGQTNPDVIEPGHNFVSIAQHQHCDGQVPRAKISDTNSVIYCKTCNLRVIVPLEVKTIGDLRNWAVIQDWSRMKSGSD